MTPDLERILRTANIIAENSIETVELVNRGTFNNEALFTIAIAELNRVIQLENLILQTIIKLTTNEPETTKQETRPKL